MITLPIFSANSFDFTYVTTLGGRKFRIRMVWNYRLNAWNLTVQDTIGGEVAGIRVTPNLPLLRPWRAQIHMEGDILCLPVDGVGDPGYASFANGNFQMVYMTGAELAAWMLARPAQPNTFVPIPPPTTFTDPADGSVYGFVNINGVTWMSSNYRRSGYGHSVSNNSSNDAIHGRLYDWAEMIGFTIPGWHLATESELQALMTYVGSSNNYALRKTTTWNVASGTDIYGFGATGSGYRSVTDIQYDVGDYGYIWSTLNNGASGSVLFINGSSSTMAVSGQGKGSHCSVRFVKDA